MVKLYQITCLLNIFFSYVIAIDFFYINITEIYVDRDKLVEWSELRIEIYQPPWENLPILFQRKENNIHIISQKKVKIYFWHLFKIAQLKISVVTKIDKTNFQTETFMIDIDIPNEKNKPCEFINNIYMSTHEQFSLNTGIQMKMCLERNVSNSKEISHAIERFHKFQERILNSTCEPSFYKFSPSHGKMICLCNYKNKKCNGISFCNSGGRLCSNAGICVENNRTASCSCLSFYTGKMCERKAVNCFIEMCLNGGVCQSSESSDTYCDCPYGAYGSYCQHLVTCPKSYCKNNGICRSSYSSFRCDCPYEFTGYHCEHPSSLCPTCFNNGVCITPDKGKTYVCDCTNGFVGSQCEIPVELCDDKFKCENLGNCYKINKSKDMCYCHIMNGSKQCGNKTKCTTLCQNGTVCTEIENSISDGKYNKYICTCPFGFSGGNCRIQNHTLTMKTENENRFINNKAQFDQKLNLYSSNNYIIHSTNLDDTRNDKKKMSINLLEYIFRKYCKQNRHFGNNDVCPSNDIDVSNTSAKKRKL